MDITLKLIPFVSDQYSLEKKFLKIPVSFSYEDYEGSMVHTITDGLPIIGKRNVENDSMYYSIGNNCSIEQLMNFIDNLNHRISCSITFNETESEINCIEYDASNNIWKHKIGSKLSGFGSTLTMHLSDDSMLRFIRTFDDYRKLAFVSIEGLRKLFELTY